jgi:predicted SprT family Zn-dependent metalloprotease
MRKTAKDVCEANFDFRCPECKRPLKPRRVTKEDEKDLICGGCGKEFDCNDLSPSGEDGSGS